MGELPRTCANCCCSAACAASCIHAGISSRSSSTKYSAIGRLQQRKSKLLTPIEILLGARHRQLAHALDHADALGHGDGAACVEGVEDVRALQRPVVRRQHERLRQAPLRLGLVRVEELPVQGDVGDFEVVLRELVLVLLAHRPVAEAAPPLDVEDRRLPRQEHGQSLAAVGDLRADRREIDAAGLLEVRELRDLHPVEQGLPPHAPRAERGRLPVVLFEADVVASEVEAERAQGVEIEVLHVERRRLEDDLKLVVLAEAKGVVAVAPVGGAAGGLDVADVPRLGAEDAQERGGVHRAGADLEVERRLDHAAALSPEVLQPQDEVLEREARHGARIIRAVSRSTSCRSWWCRSSRQCRSWWYPSSSCPSSSCPSSSCRSAEAEAAWPWCRSAAAPASPSCPFAAEARSCAAAAWAATPARCRWSSARTAWRWSSAAVSSSASCAERTAPRRRAPAWSSSAAARRWSMSLACRAARDCRAASGSWSCRRPCSSWVASSGPAR